MKKKSDRFIHILFTLPAFLLFLLLFIVRLISGMYYGITDWKGFNNDFNIVGLSNYTEFLGDRQAMSALKFSLVYTVLLTVFVLAAATFLALILTNGNLSFRTKKAFRTIYFFPAILSLIVVGLIWNEIFYRALPLIGEMLNIEFLKTNILASKNTAMFGILIVNVWQGVAIPFVMITAAMQNVPTDLYECAELEGIKPLKKFTHITFPFIIPTFNVALVLTVRSGLTVFDYIQVLTKGGPGGSTRSIGLFIYEEGIINMNYGYSTAASIILMVIGSGMCSQQSPKIREWSHNVLL
ncbi:sugar ABC transporter permease [Faecalicatena contorta]|uniref:carbohydrate ABC transporter permease n=1 Tax=Faecalicatena contorta TaxID=39482 RepID=UPI00129E147A|nr:sugar ABC transporter permease [Faecalicatena contorta]MRM88977.1 sugar ABC transporter permease [Faecalicatena contorta]